MGQFTSRSTNYKRQSAVCAVCLGPVYDESLPILDCQHRLCLRCLTRFSGKTVRKGEKYPSLNQCPVCAELIFFPDSSTKPKSDDSVPGFKFTDEDPFSVTSSKPQPSTEVTKESTACSGRKRQHDELTDDSDAEFLDADGAHSSNLDDTSRYIDCMMCYNHKPKRKKTLGTVFCFDCNMVLCEACKENHDLRPRCQGHMLCPVTSETIQDLVCKVHRQLAEDYCTDCKCVTCADCHVTEHRGHKIRAFTVSNLDESIFKELEESKVRNKKFLNSVTSMEKLYFAELISTKEAVAKSRREIIDAIKEHFNSMSSRLDAEEQKAKESFDDVRRSVMDDDMVINDLIDKGHQLVSPIGSIPSLHISNGNELLEDLRQKIPCKKHMLQQPDTFIYIPAEDIKTNYGQLVKVPLAELDKCIELD